MGANRVSLKFSLNIMRSRKRKGVHHSKIQLQRRRGIEVAESLQALKWRIRDWSSRERTQSQI